jgi:hypothetical protein
MMIVGVYAMLGAFLIYAARDPDANKSLIWFAIVSSLVHGAIMGIQSFGDTGGMGHMGHLAGDVPALLLVAIVLFLLMWMPRQREKHKAFPSRDNGDLPDAGCPLCTHSQCRVQDGTHIGRAAHEQRLRACGEILEGSLDGICRARA